MPRNASVELATWPALTLEGNLIAPAMVARIDRREATEQTEPDYGVRKGLSVREEIALAFRVGQAHFDHFTRSQHPSAAATVRFVQDFLTQTLAFNDLEPGTHPVALQAGNSRIPIVVVPPDEALDRRSPTLSTDRSRAPSFSLQDHLNGRADALWGLVTNGTRWRLMRDNASLTRPAFIEVDLAQIFTTEDIASFAIAWLLLHRSRFGKAGTPAPDCALERWRDAGSREGEAARDRLSVQVEEALRILGTGFLGANPALAERLRDGRLDRTVWFNELLRLVYRLIFLMVAEDRDLLHPPDTSPEARQLYAQGYSLKQLRAQAVRRASWNHYHDRYEGLKVVFRALAAGEPRLGLPALGGLFHPGLFHSGPSHPGPPYSELLYPELAYPGQSRSELSHPGQPYSGPSHSGSSHSGSSHSGLSYPGPSHPEFSHFEALDDLKLPNRAFMEALWRLSWLPSQQSMVPINWRAMETEELGSVYESLLELQPQLSADGRALRFATDQAERKGSQRKTTGSYYTPDSLVQVLLDTTLDPVLDRTEAEANDPEAALLTLSVIDPACGSGHFLLAAARRIATRVARIRAEGTPALVDFRHALRDVARSCLYGVDRNPMAVELTKVALWIETVDPGRPLGFFDAQIRCGDSLLGVFDLNVLQDGIPDAAYKPLTGDDKNSAKYYLKANRDAKSGQGELDLFGDQGGTMPALKPLATDFFSLRNLAEDTAEQIGAKAQRFNELRASPTYARTQAAADLYLAAFLVPKTAGPAGFAGSTHSADPTTARTVPTTNELWRALHNDSLSAPMQAAQAAAHRARVFHWPLEFPDVMARGGFDVVLGNPPWERIKLQEQEFFAARSPEIAGAANKAARERLIKALGQAPSGTSERELHNAFITAKHEAEATSEFVRLSAKDSGRFPLTGRGDVNTYALFAELFTRLTRDRAGVIVPTGIATDATTAPFFAHLVEKKRLARLVDFENRNAIFPGVHRSYKFSLLTLGRNETKARFAFFLTDPAQLAEPERNFTLTPADIAAINPNTKTAPVFRSRADAELTAKIYRNAPVLIDESKGKDGNPWGVTFSAMFHMSNDSHLFRTAAQLAQDGWQRAGTDWIKNNERFVPLYEAKMIHQFDHRWAGYSEDGQSAADLTLTQKQNPAFEPAPRYWVPKREVEDRLRAKDWTRGWLMGWRDIARATDERTVIASSFPKAGVNHKFPLYFVEIDHSSKYLLLANLNSLTLDFVARQKVGGTNLAFFLIKQFPVFNIDFYKESHLSFIIPRVLELSYTTQSLEPFARDLGYDGPPFPWDESRRAELRADLDAFFARAYGLTRDELRYILDPAAVKGPDYPSETFRVLKDKEIRQFGEYRTQRLVLAAWDRMEASGEFTRLGI